MEFGPDSSSDDHFHLSDIEMDRIMTKGYVVYGDGDGYTGQRATKITTHIDKVIIDGVSNVEKLLFHTNWNRTSQVLFRNVESEFHNEFKIITGSPVIEANLTFLEIARFEPNYDQQMFLGSWKNDNSFFEISMDEINRSNI